MNDSTINVLIGGLLVGAAFGLLGIISDMVWKLVRSRSEGARRFKLVSSVAIVLLVGSAMVAGMGPLGALGACIVIAAIVWVFKGFKKTESVIPTPGSTAPFRRYGAEEDATEFMEVTDTAPERKTVITCLNCDGRLRVLAGKYVDVTCPHCQTVFRTHT